MRKKRKRLPIKSWFVLGVLFAFSLGLGLLSSSRHPISSRARATGPQSSGKIVSVSGTDVKAIQQAIDSAQNGDTILIKAGTYSGSQGLPYTGSNTQATCFINLGQKNLTLKGENGTILFGEGHDKPDTYASRAGICSDGGAVTIDNIRVKEFQGGGLRFTGGSLILKNSIIEGNDSGGMHFNNTSLLAVNNFFVANIGVQPRGLASIKVINNTFFSSKGINADCHKDLPSIDFVNNIVVDAELTIGAGWIVGDCPETVAQFKTKNIAYNIIWKENHPCYENHEYCTDFKGKINADPAFIEPVIDQRGMAGWANFGFKEGSPAVGAGDPTIPGPKNIGSTGGPCVDPSSSTCTTYISQNIPQPGESSPETGPGGGSIENPENPANLPTAEPSSSSSESQPIPLETPIQKKTPSLFIIENMGFGNITINGLQLKVVYVPLNRKLKTGQAVEYPLSSICQSDIKPFTGQVLYTDEKGKLSFTGLTVYCDKTNVFDIQ